MRALDQKLFRDLLRMWEQVLAICLVMACGVSTFVMSLCTLESLKRSQNEYYERYHFAQVFAHVKRAPASLSDRIAELPGVAQVQIRITEHATLDVPGLKEPAVARLISIPDRPAPMLNELYLRSGRYVDPSHHNEVLVSEGFANAHGLKAGDQLFAVINHKKQPLRIVGIALSPEYIYQIREGDLLPDDRRFGIIWMAQTELAAAFDMTGAFNDITLTLTPDASETEVIRQLDLLTAKYGSLGAYGRSDQSSHEFVSNEMNELEGMAVMIPSIFFLVSAFLKYVVISRLIGTQREQIATLKAFGYTPIEILWHYLKLVMLIVVVGVIFGTLVGSWLGREVTQMYTRFFHFPVFSFYLAPWVVVTAFLITATLSLFATMGAVWRAVRIPAAEAMQPESPASYRASWFEKLSISKYLPVTTRMMLRQMSRRPVKTLITLLGISLATAVVILGSFSLDAINYAIEAQYFIAQRHDIAVSFVEPTSTDSLQELQHYPGVRYCEPARVVAARLRSENQSRRIGIMGIEPNSELFRIADVNRNVFSVPEHGIVLSKKLGELLNVQPGDVLTVEILEGNRPVRSVSVSALVEDFSGTVAYMHISEVNRLMLEGNVITTAFLSVDKREQDQLYYQLKNTPRVASVTVKSEAISVFRQTIAENLLIMRLFNVIFAGVIAFGVLFNSARIALAERSRELATLRVLGFSRGEVSRILLEELTILTLLAIPVGLVIGYLLAFSVIHVAYNTELFRLPLVIDRWTYGFAASVTLAAGLFSVLVIQRRVNRLDLIAVLKSRD